MTAAGLNLDTGAFAALLEYATGRLGVVVGKPAPIFFQAALERVGLSAADVIVIGDDVSTDIAGASALGLRSVLVQTGKYAYQPVAEDRACPTLVIESLARLPQVVQYAGRSGGLTTRCRPTGTRPRFSRP